VPLSPRRWFGFVGAREGEARLVAWAAAYSFALMASYNVLKPYRDALGTATRGIGQLWTGTFVVCLVVLVPYWAVVARFSRQQFVPWVHRFFALVFVVSWWLLRDEKRVPFALDFVTVAASFYVVVSVFNLLVISQMWGLLADVFQREQGERLFAAIAAGGTLGGLAGSGISSTLAPWFARHGGPAGLVWIAVALLEVTTLCAVRLALRSPPSAWQPPERGRTFARHLHAIFEGAKLLVRSPVLLAITAYMFVSLFTSACAYGLQRDLLRLSLPDRARQTAYLANVNLATQLAALVGQLFVARWLLRRVGLGVTLSLLHVVGLLGLLVFGVVARIGPHGAIGVAGATAMLYAISGAWIAIKAADYALAKPARETLFTVLSRAEKYQSKSLIDAGLYRGFDMLDGWSYDALRLPGQIGLGGLVGLALPMETFAFVVAPVSILGVGASWLLARQRAPRPSRATDLDPAAAAISSTASADPSV
jgi:AAA family ATP:ADP antiporter